MRLPSASQLDRARLCPASAILPRVREVSAGMTAGTVRHRFLQRCLEADRSVALAEIEDPTLRSMCDALELADLPLDPKAYAAEVAFAYNVTTGQARELGRALGRDYSAVGPDELPGTSDTVALVGDDAVFVSDFKAQWDGVPPLRRNLQLRFLGLAAARAYGRERAIIEIIRPGEERAWRERAELDMFDLLDVEEELRELVANVRASAADVPSFVVGEHCRRCPCLRTPCPAVMAIVIAADRESDALVAREERQLTVQTVARTMGRVKAARAALDKIEAACEAVAWQTPIPLEDGRVWGPVLRRYETYDAKTMVGLLLERYGFTDETVWDVIDLKVVKDRVTDKVLRPLVTKPKVKPRVTLKALTDQLEEELAARDGLKVTQQEELRVHRPPKETQ